MTTQPPRALSVRLLPEGVPTLIERIDADRRLIAVERAAGLRVLCCHSEQQADDERRSLRAGAGHGQRCFLDVRELHLSVDLEGDDASRDVAYDVLTYLGRQGVVESVHDMDSGEAWNLDDLRPTRGSTTRAR